MRYMIGWLVILVLGGTACSPSPPPTVSHPPADSVRPLDSGAVATGSTPAPSPDAIDGSTTEMATLPTSTTGAAAAWPCWRGVRGDGISNESGWNTQWPATGPPQAWQTNVGIGFSSVSVAGGRLFTMGYRGDGDVVYCFDAATGKKHWEYAYPCALVDNLHEGGPGATPTVDGSSVYTLSREGHVHCFHTADGKVQWRKELKSELRASQPDWGFTSSPYVVGSLVVVDVGYVVAMNKVDGSIVWKSPEYRAGYGTAIGFEQDGRALLSVLNNDGLLVLQAADGQPVAMEPWESQYATSSTTPIVHGSTLFVSVGYGGGCRLLRLDGARLNEVYRNRDMSNHFNNCVLYEGHLYGFDGNSGGGNSVRLVCMEHATGKVKWQQRGFGCGSLMVADGKLIVLGESGELAIVTATPGGFEPLARAPVVEGKCWSMPVLVGGRIYCRTADGKLVGLDVRKAS